MVFKKTSFPSLVGKGKIVLTFSFIFLFYLKDIAVVIHREVVSRPEAAGARVGKSARGVRADRTRVVAKKKRRRRCQSIPFRCKRR